MIPVYLFLGFLESGKTAFVQETLQDPAFNTGEKTLLVLCEEGVEEYEPDKFAGQNVRIMTVDSPDELTSERLYAEGKKINAERVLIEYNGMWETSVLANAFPKQWQLFQAVMVADASTFPAYLQNMRQLAADKIQLAEMVIFNRTDASTDKAFLHRNVKILNRRAQMMFEYKDGTVMPDDIKDELPFDITAQHFTVQDTDYGLWYMDAMEEPQKYAGKTVTFKAMVCQTKQVAKDCFVPGRFCMTCCADDITFIGMICQLNGQAMPAHRSWVDITADISLRKHKIYEGEGPWLTLKSITYNAQPPKDELVYFT